MEAKDLRFSEKLPYRAPGISNEIRLSTATTIRRQERNKQSQISFMRWKMAKMFREGMTPKEIYKRGEHDGELERVKGLTDILFQCKQSGLGAASIIQESNSHLVFKINNHSVTSNDSVESRCYYLAGYLAGTLKSIGKPSNLRVQEVSEYQGQDSVFVASW